MHCRPSWNRLSSFFLSIALGLLAPATFAQTAVCTPPIGVVNLTAAAGSGSTAMLSVLSFPLLGEAPNDEKSSGYITGITPSTISDSTAGWTAGALSEVSSPYLIQITSGSAAGRIFLISTSATNTATTITIDAQDSAQVDLTTLGIVTGSAGDTYSIFGCDTLSSLFGAGTATSSTTAVLGGTSATSSDIVQLSVGGGWRQYYYDIKSAHWLRVGLKTNSDNLPIRPDMGVLYLRMAACPLNLTATGHVPLVNRKTFVTNSGLTFFSSYWPVDTTLASSNISSIPGWIANASSTNADYVQLSVMGGWRQYYFDGTNWRRVGLKTVSDTLAIPCGTAVILVKQGTASGISTLTQAVPYSF